MPSTRTIGGVPALRCKSLARAAIIFSSTLRMFMGPSDARGAARTARAPRRFLPCPPGRPARREARPSRLDQEELLSVLHGLGVLDQDPNHAARRLVLDLVHQLHRLDRTDR